MADVPHTVTAVDGVSAVPPPQTEAADAGGASAIPRAAPLQQESAMAADAESVQPPPAVASPPLTPMRRDDDDTVKDDGKEDVITRHRRQSRWSGVRPPVLWLLSLFRLRREKQLQLIGQPNAPLPTPPEEEKNVVPDNKAAAVEKDRGNKRRREEGTPMPASTKKLQNAARLVKKLLSWHRRHRSSATANGAETKPPPREKETVNPKQEQQTTKESPHELWPWAEQKLDRILEDACARLVAAELNHLRRNKKKERQCLLTSFVFDLGAEVKKQAMTYWWSTQFRLTPGGADAVFSELALAGFLEPIKNHCSGVIHGCRVNPLVHWAVKKEVRGRNVAAGREDDGGGVGGILCLTTANRDLLHKISKVDALVAQYRFTKSPDKKTHDRLRKMVQELAQSEDGPPHKSVKDVEITERKNKENVEAAESLSMFDDKRVIVNISAHVYKLPAALLANLADRLEVLQLGRWRNSDDDTYMEVHALESLSAIGKLKNLRYLSLRGLSRLTTLPAELERLRQLTILDARGCQNLVTVPSRVVNTLTRLTHLDLAECYMLEHIGSGVAGLSELQVFKGFVFSVGKRRGSACHVQDLARLRKLRKLSVNVTTDAFVEKGDMAALVKLKALVSLTVTWSELPSVLLTAGKKGEKRLETLIGIWTDLQLPSGLEKLDVRCSPISKLPYKWFCRSYPLTKLYVRGGDVEEIEIPKTNRIAILRLRYLNEFKMTWVDLLAKLEKIERVEVVDMDLKVTRNQTKQILRKGKDGKEVEPMKKRMRIPDCTLDDVGVWVRDVKIEKQVSEPMSYISPLHTLDYPDLPYPVASRQRI